MDSTIKAAMVYMEQEDSNVALLDGGGKQENRAVIFERLQSISKISDYIYSIYYFEENSGSIFLSSGLSFDRDEFYDREWVNNLNSERDFFILPARMLPTVNGGERNVIPIVIKFPLNSGTHKYTYVIYLDAYSLFQYIIRNVEVSGERSFKTIDHTGMIIMSSDSKVPNFSNIRDSQFDYPETILSETGGSFQIKREKKNILISFNSSKTYGWKYISEVSFEAIAQNMLVPLKVILVISLLLLAFSILVGIYISEEMYKPVKKIMQVIGMPVVLDGEKDEYDIIRRYMNKYLDENKHLHTIATENLPIVRKQFFYSLVANNTFSLQEVQEKLKFFNIRLGEAYIVLLLEIDDWENYNLEFNLEDRLLWELAMENISMECMGLHGEGFFIGLEASRMAIVFSNDNCSSEELNQKAAQLAYEIKEAIKSCLKFTVSVGVGRITNEITALYRSFQEAVTSLSFKDKIGKDEVILFSEVNLATNITVNYPYELDRSLTQYILLGDNERSTMIVNSIFEVLKNQKYVHKTYLNIFCSLLLNSLMKQIIDLDIKEDEVFKEYLDFAALTSRVLRLREFDECIIIFTDIVQNMCTIINEHRQLTNHTQVKVIIDYINEHYAEPISMELVADYTGMNRCYVGRLFKQYINLSMTDYLNQIRIKKAVNLLNTTDMKILEISEKVGFNSTHYFIKIFRKVMNMTPGQYRDTLGKFES